MLFKEIDTKFMHKDDSNLVDFKFSIMRSE